MTRLIIAGSRQLDSNIAYKFIEATIELYNLNPSEIVSGGASGVDKAGEDYARNNNLKLTIMRPDWNSEGLAAGPIRNGKMAAYGNELLLVWDGLSKGSKSMRNEANKAKLSTYEVVIKHELLKN